MSGEINGAIVVLKVEDGTVPGTYNVLANQVDTGMADATVMADTSSKSHPNETGKPQLSSLGITCTYIPDPTDDAHIELQTALDTRVSVNIEAIREDGTAKYAGAYFVGENPVTAPVTDVARRSVSLTPAGTITVT